jgi:hypothetical protein
MMKAKLNKLRRELLLVAVCRELLVRGSVSMLTVDDWFRKCTNFVVK